jgi:hypothetical protein
MLILSSTKTYEYDNLTRRCDLPLFGTPMAEGIYNGPGNEFAHLKLSILEN